MSQHGTSKPACQPAPITRLGPRKTTIRLEGQILGTTYRGRDVDHYRVAGLDGTVYLCPPEWLPNDPLGIEQAQHEHLVALLKALPGLWRARRERLLRGEPV